MIKTIPMWKMLMATRGKKTGIAVLAALPVLIFTGAWMFLEGLQNGKNRQAVIGFLCMVFFGMCTLLFAPSRKYVPGKSFKGYRNKKLGTKAAINYGYGIFFFVIAVFLVLVPERTMLTIGYGIAGIVALYTMSKSLKFHADVDFTTNEYLATALGFSAGEKILVSYQNFEADEVQGGCNAFAATATTLIVASYDGSLWEKLSRDLRDLSHIGIAGDENQNYFVKLQFNDGADALLRIGLYEKLTSNPFLVIRKLLETIDASVLGGSGASQTGPRRRVVVNSETPDRISKIVEPEPETAFRNIEVFPDVLVAIQNAEKVAPGRRLEL